MDELQDEIPEDHDDCEEFAPDGSLGSMLEEYRKHKQEKQFKLEERAVRDGRPFSAPVASPSCDDIKKRQLDSRALKDARPDVRESRVEYHRPVSGPAKLRRSTSEGGPPSPREINAHGSGEVEYTLDAVPEEAAGIGAQKPESTTAPPPKQQSAKESGDELDDNRMERLRLEDVDELEDWVHDSHSGESAEPQPIDSEQADDYEDMMQTAETADELEECEAQPQQGLAGYTESAFNSSDTVPAPDECDSPEQPASSVGEHSDRAVDAALGILGSIVETAVISQRLSPSGSSECSSAAQHTEHSATLTTDFRHPGQMQTTLELTSSAPMQSAGAALSPRQGTTADGFSFDDTDNNYGAAGTYYRPLTGAQLQGTGNGGAGAPARGTTLSFTVDRALGSIVSSVCDGPTSEEHPGELSSRVSTASQQPARPGASAEGADEPTCAIFLSPASGAAGSLGGGHATSSSAQGQLSSGSSSAQGQGLQAGPGSGESGVLEHSGGALDSTQVHLDDSNIQSHQGTSGPGAVSHAAPPQPPECLELADTGNMGKQTGRSDTQLVEHTQPSPFPRPQPCLPHMLSGIPSQSSCDGQTASMQQTTRIAPASTASPLPRPAPQMFATGSVSNTGTLNFLWQTEAILQDRTQPVQLVLGQSTGAQESSDHPERIMPTEAADTEGAGDAAVSMQPEQQEHSDTGPAGACIVPPSSHTEATPDCYSEPAKLVSEDLGDTLAPREPASSVLEAPAETQPLEQFLSASDASLVEAVSHSVDPAAREVSAGASYHVQQSLCVAQHSSEWVQPGLERQNQEQPDQEKPEQEHLKQTHPGREKPEQAHHGEEQPKQAPVEPRHADQDHCEQRQPDQAHPGRKQPEQEQLEPVHSFQEHAEQDPTEQSHLSRASTGQDALEEAQPERDQPGGTQTPSVQRTWQEEQPTQETAELDKSVSQGCTAEACATAHALHAQGEAVVLTDSSLWNSTQTTLEVTTSALQSVCTPAVEAIETAAVWKDRSGDDTQHSAQVDVSPHQQTMKVKTPSAEQAQKSDEPTGESALSAELPSGSTMASHTSLPQHLSQAEAAVQQPAAMDDSIHPTQPCQPRNDCSHCGAKKESAEACSTVALAASEVLDRLALFACGRMGAEALLQGDVAAALQQLLNTGTQDGMALVASVLRRSVTLTIGQRSAANPHTPDATSPIVQILSQVVGMMIEAAKVPDLIPQLLEAHWDTVLTEVPRALGPLYQQARSALQQLLHTEECLLSAVHPGTSSTRPAASRTEQHPATTLPPPGRRASRRISTEPREAEAKAQPDHCTSGKQRHMAPAVLAACECGRPVVFGAPTGWEIVPQGGHVHARRTVSGKNRARKGGTLSASIKKHMEEAMQPDGADLEYVYLGPSRGASPPGAPPRSPVYIAAYSPAPGTDFIQEDSSPYAAVDDWSAAPRLMAAKGAGHRTSGGSARGARPKTAGARSGPAWDDSPAGIPPRTRSQDGPGLRQHPDGPSYRPGSAEPYSSTRHQQNRLTPSRMNAPHAWVGTYWDRELSPYVRESFEHAQGALMAQQAAQSSSNWLRDQLGQGQSRGGWIHDERFQMPSGSQFPSRAQLAPQQHQQQGWEARAAYNSQADNMQAVYTEQLNEMLRYANQCSVMLESKYRYKAARRRPASAATGKYRVATALEGCVERHVVAADGASTLQDPGMIKMMSCAKFMALLEQLAVRVNAVRGISGKKKTASKARRRGAGMVAR